MTLAEAFVKSIKDQALGIAWTVPGQPAIKLSLAGPRVGTFERGLKLDVDLNVGYHVYCRDAATVAAYYALRQFERRTGAATEKEGADIDLSALLDTFDVDWCEENEQLQAAGHSSVAAAAQSAWRMGELAICLQATAYALGLWDPSDK
jgi:hypothetical protein